jgi:hypothetical protein
MTVEDKFLLSLSPVYPAGMNWFTRLWRRARLVRAKLVFWFWASLKDVRRARERKKELERDLLTIKNCGIGDMNRRPKTTILWPGTGIDREVSLSQQVTNL